MKYVTVVPTISLRVAAKLSEPLEPLAVRQTNALSEFHDVVAHLVAPTRGSGVASSKPKFVP